MSGSEHPSLWSGIRALLCVCIRGEEHPGAAAGGWNGIEIRAVDQ